MARRKLHKLNSVAVWSEPGRGSVNVQVALVRGHSHVDGGGGRRKSANRLVFARGTRSQLKHFVLTTYLKLLIRHWIPWAFEVLESLWEW